MNALPDALDAVIDRARPLSERFTADGHRLFFVGGVVRDHLLGRPRRENDLDATTDARPREIKALIADLADAVWTQGERFGTIGCRVDGQVYEITTHRAESYAADSRKPEVVFGDRIEDDLARRDFTVNAMAVDLHDRRLVDPHDGRADLDAGRLRTPLDPVVSFSEDPLRMLRAARFHAGYGLEPAPELVDAMKGLLERIDIVSVERIRDELEKLLLLPDPAPGLGLLADTGLLGRVLPPLAGLTVDGAVERGRGVAAVTTEAAGRWAALLAPAGIGPADLAALRFSGALARDVVWFATAADWASAPGHRPATAARVRRDAALAPADRTLDELLAWVEGLRRVADRPVGDLDEYRGVLADLRAAEPDLDDPAPLLDGAQVGEVLGIAPGREIGVAMRWLRDLRFDEGPMTADEAATRLRRWWPTRSDA
jgi:poly(A) polymerase